MNPHSERLTDLYRNGPTSTWRDGTLGDEVRRVPEEGSE